MILQAARNILVSDRYDWNKPHLRWISKALYRITRSDKDRG